ncbi:NYN domain-containing protein [Sinomonas flava]|uniref:NYN domain-containing protein n=1 Tax=Sinomonas flava TaxID=496857 RepID=UPI0039A5F1C9
MATGFPPQRNVAVFIDMENLFGGYSRDVTTVPLARVIAGIDEKLRGAGKGALTATVRAYANWARPDMRAYQGDILNLGIEPVQVFSFDKAVKNAADIQLCVDAMAVEQDSPWIDVFVIVTGDGGFVPLVRRLHDRNKYVIVVSTNAPDAGAVSSFLSSVADEFHVIDVRPPVVIRRVSAAQPNKPAPPTLDEYRAAILALVEQSPELRTKGDVNTMQLGKRLRQMWPDTTFKDFGSRTLGAFIEKHCGLTVHRPAAQPEAVQPTTNPAQAPQGKATVPAKATAPPSSAERGAYLRAVRRLFLHGPMSAAVDAATRLPLATVGSLVRQHVPGKTHSDAGYGKFADMLRDALVGTPYSLGRDEKHAYVERSASLLQA